MLRYQSNAEWPENTVYMPDGTQITTDNHASKDEAQEICDTLEAEGFGGEGKIFPIKTWVSFTGSVEK